MKVAGLLLLILSTSIVVGQIRSDAPFGRPEIDGVSYHHIVVHDSTQETPWGDTVVITTLYTYPFLTHLPDPALQNRLNRYLMSLVIDTAQVLLDPDGKERRGICMRYLGVSDHEPEAEPMLFYESVDVTFVANGILSYTYATMWPGGAHPTGNHEGRTIVMEDQSALPLDRLFLNDYKCALINAVRSQIDTTSVCENKKLITHWLSAAKSQCQ